MNAPKLENLTDTVQDVAHKVADRTPDIASVVGRNARTTAETVGHTVSDAVVRLAQKTPFLDAPTPQRRGRWMFRAALVATIAGIALWMINRRRTSEPWLDVDDAPTAKDTAVTSERRLASAGN